MRRPSEFDSYPAALSNLAPFGPYRAVAKHIVDGDTLDVFVDLGLNKYAYETIRIRGLNTPELRGGDPAERAKGALARDALRALLPLNTPVVVYTFKDTATFGRYVADVYTADGTSVAVVMRPFAV